ncbi:MAG: DUF3857 domain-containing protein [Bacteroidales bacterium]|nr:DUF3857 domain-containing protein [Bacteroidales bacterium]
MKKAQIYILLIFLSLTAIAQKDPIKWKKLTKEEIELKEYKGASAVVLYDYGQMYFDINPNGENLFLFRKRHVRIKILNEAGLKYAKIKFSYNDMSCEQYFGEQSYYVKAVTHNIDETGQIIVSKVKNRDIKITDSVRCIKNAEFEFPNAKIGSILEYIITIPTLKLIKPDSWHFQSKIPVIYSEFRAKIPQKFKYVFSVKNIEELPVKDSSFYDKLISYKYKINRNTYSAFMDLSGKEYRFVNKYMPVLQNKKDEEKINIHLKRITAEPSDYSWEKLTKALMITTWSDYDRRTPVQRKNLSYPAPYVIYYLPSWSELNENLLYGKNFGLALIKYWNCKSIIDSVIENKQTEREKAEAIYNFVRKKMKWNNKYSIYADVSDSFIKKMYGKIGASVKLNNVGLYFDEGTGTSAEINFVLMHLLKKAGLKVYPVLANTFDNEILDKNISQINQFKSVIALLEIGNNKYLLDAAEKDSKFSEISKKYDPEQMFIIRRTNFGWLSE